MPYHDQAALRAATLTHFDPASVERVLHFLLRLASCLDQGAHLQAQACHGIRLACDVGVMPQVAGTIPSKDAAFLLACTLDILLGEVQWLLTLLRVQQGHASPPLLRVQQGHASPHVRVLHATLRAYDAKVSRATWSRPCQHTGGRDSISQPA